MEYKKQKKDKRDIRKDQLFIKIGMLNILIVKQNIKKERPLW